MTEGRTLVEVGLPQVSVYSEISPVRLILRERAQRHTYAIERKRILSVLEDSSVTVN